MKITIAEFNLWHHTRNIFFYHATLYQCHFEKKEETMENPGTKSSNN
jgi:hypothetical protein